MVGLESSIKGTAFYIDENGEYKEIGKIENIKQEENNNFDEMEDLYKKQGLQQN